MWLEETTVLRPPGLDRTDHLIAACVWHSCTPPGPWPTPTHHAVSLLCLFFIIVPVVGPVAGTLLAIMQCVCIVRCMHVMSCRDTSCGQQATTQWAGRVPLRGPPAA